MPQSPWLEGAAGTNLAAQGISVSCVEGGTNGEIYFEVPSNVGFVVSGHRTTTRNIRIQNPASGATPSYCTKVGRGRPGWQSTKGGSDMFCDTNT